MVNLDGLSDLRWACPLQNDGGLETYERERDRDLSHFDSVDAKAGVVLGFAGVVAAIAFNAAQLFRRFSFLLGLSAAILAVAAFWPRKLPALEPGRLRDYLVAEERITRLVLVDTYQEMLDKARLVLGTKSRRLKYAMVLLALAGLASAIGEITR